MASQYSTKTFLRQVRVPLLKRYVDQKQLDLDLDIIVVKPADIDRLYERLQSLPPDVFRQVEIDWAAITEVANPAGSAALLREAKHAGLDWSYPFAEARNAYERALWAYLQDPSIFERSGYMYAIDRVASGRWHRWFVGVAAPASVDPAQVALLSERVRAVYLKEGRGRRCHIDYYLRPAPLRHCFFAYPEDHTTTDLGYGEDDVLRRRARRSAFEVIFVYRPEDGTLEVLAPGGKDRAEDLADQFCNVILGLTELPPEARWHTMNLNRLLDPAFVFTAEEQDGIDATYVRELGLNLPDGRKRRVTFAAKPTPWRPDAVHELIDDALNEENVPRSSARVARARLTLQFKPRDGQKAKVLTFDLSSPDRCSLKDEPYDQIAKRCLRRWGITADRGAALAVSAA